MIQELVGLSRWFLFGVLGDCNLILAGAEAIIRLALVTKISLSLVGLAGGLVDF
jgi:hypothetical protein